MNSPCGTPQFLGGQLRLDETPCSPRAPPPARPSSQHRGTQAQREASLTFCSCAPKPCHQPHAVTTLGLDSPGTNAALLVARVQTGTSQDSTSAHLHEGSGRAGTQGALPGCQLSSPLPCWQFSCCCHTPVESLQHLEATGSGFHLCNFKLSKSQFPLPARGDHTGIKCTNLAKGPRMAGRSDRYYPGVTLTPPWEVHVTGLSGLLEPQALCFPAPEASLSHRVTKHEPARATQ